jgi:signal transduction histidine kinase
VVAVSPEVTRLQSDEHKLFRILVNLIENAAKYAPDGPIELEAIAGGDKVLFFVTDHGPGISRADRERVFERFVQGQRDHGRSNRGLGLAFCKLAIEAHGGRIWIEDAVPGAAFCLWIDHAD